jgi:hypothetical protein
VGVAASISGCAASLTSGGDSRDTSPDLTGNRDVQIKNEYANRTTAMAVTVSQNPDEQPVFQGQYTLYPGSNVVVEGVVATAGEYTVAVEKDGRQTASVEWSVPDDGDVDIRAEPDRELAIFTLAQSGVLYGERVGNAPSGAPVVPESDDRIAGIEPIRSILDQVSAEAENASESLSGRAFEQVEDALHLLPKYVGDDAGYYVSVGKTTVRLTFAVTE